MPTASALAIPASAMLPGAHRARRSQGGIAWEVASGLIGRRRWPVVRIAGARAERGHRAQTRRMWPRRRCGGARPRSTTGSGSGPPKRGPSAFRGPLGLDGRVWDQRRHSQTVARVGDDVRWSVVSDPRRTPGVRLSAPSPPPPCPRAPPNARTSRRADVRPPRHAGGLASRRQVPVGGSRARTCVR